MQSGSRRQGQRRRKDVIDICDVKKACNIAGFVVVTSALAVLLSLTASLGQALLAASMPAACLWALFELPCKENEEGPYPGAAWAVRILAAVSVAVAAWGEDSDPCLYAVCALASIGANTTRIPLGLPFGSFIPYSALVALCVAFIYSEEDVRDAAGWPEKSNTGPFDVVIFLIGALTVTLTLVAWSLSWVKGEHGPIQDSMGPSMSVLRVVGYSIANGIGEEIEFRALIFGGLIARPAKHDPIWCVLALLLQGAYFASLHYRGGFPSGIGGVSILFAWAVLLGCIRLMTGSVLLPILSHIQLDIVVFTLIYIEEQKRGPRTVEKDKGGNGSRNKDGDNGNIIMPPQRSREQSRQRAGRAT